MELSGVMDLKIKKNVMYFLSPYGLGDTMILCGFKDALEKKYNCKIHFFILFTDFNVIFVTCFTINSRAGTTLIDCVRQD